MEISLAEVKNIVKAGYCLWIGAGLTQQIAPQKNSTWNPQGIRVPGWEDLTKLLEEEVRKARTCGLPKPNSQSFPDRLQVCYNELGAPTFNKILRKMYYTNLCVALLKEAEHLTSNQSSSTTDADSSNLLTLPLNLRQVAALGQLANPVVSFNIESLSSFMLARPLGPAQIIPYVDREQARLVIANREISDEFARIIYHQHGLCTGDSIMTKSQYDQEALTLAYQLATHAAFGNNLLIVGKSMDGEYMFPQIKKHRKEIKEIVWFVSKPKSNGPTPPPPGSDERMIQKYAEDQAWYANSRAQFEAFKKQCEECNVRIALYNNHTELWNLWMEVRKEISQRDAAKAKRYEADLYKTWYLLLQEASYEAQGGMHYVIGKLADSMIKEALKRGDKPGADWGTAVQTAFIAKGKEIGESGQAANEINAPEILNKVKARLQEMNIPVPIVEDPVQILQTALDDYKRKN